MLLVLFLPKKKSFVTNDPDKVLKADKIIFPGQGAMPGCVEELDKRGLKEVLIESAKQKPFLGICLGLQMLFEISDEGNQKGFGLLPGKVIKFKSDYKERIKIPHMGWNSECNQMHTQCGEILEAVVNFILYIVILRKQVIKIW